MTKIEKAFVYEGNKYTLDYTIGGANIYVSEKENHCLITDKEDNVKLVIIASASQNSGFLEFNTENL